MHRHLRRNTMDLRVLYWAAQVILVDAVELPGPGSIDMTLGAPMVDDLGNHDTRTWVPRR
eukprot:14739189-Heterocapsa_arctica.AAC.1